MNEKVILLTQSLETSVFNQQAPKLWDPKGLKGGSRLATKKRSNKRKADW